MQRPNRVVLQLNDQELADLQTLAEANTSGNISEMLRSLIRRARRNPEHIGLLPPENFPKALSLQVA